MAKALLARRIVASKSPYKVSYARLAASVFNTPKEVDTAVAAVRTLAAAWPPCGYVFGLYRAWAAL